MQSHHKAGSRPRLRLADEDSRPRGHPGQAAAGQTDEDVNRNGRKPRVPGRAVKERQRPGRRRGVMAVPYFTGETMEGACRAWTGRWSATRPRPVPSTLRCAISRRARRLPALTPPSGIAREATVACPSLPLAQDDSTRLRITALRPDFLSFWSMAKNRVPHAGLRTLSSIAGWDLSRHGGSRRWTAGARSLRQAQGRLFAWLRVPS
jgi:hypothetical protein